MRSAVSCPIDGPCGDCAWELHELDQYCPLGDAARMGRPIEQAVAEALDLLLSACPRACSGDM